MNDKFWNKIIKASSRENVQSLNEIQNWMY